MNRQEKKQEQIRERNVSRVRVNEGRKSKVEAASPFLSPSQKHPSPTPPNTQSQPPLLKNKLKF